MKKEEIIQKIGTIGDTVKKKYPWLKEAGRIRAFFESIVMKTYPFTEKNGQGQKVYLDQAYRIRHGLCESRLGKMPHIKCYRIFLWRELLHLWVGIMFWAIATGIQYYHGKPWGLILPLFLVVFFTIQEFVLDRLHYDQSWLRGLIDWIVWIGPLIAFALIHYVF